MNGIRIKIVVNAPPVLMERDDAPRGLVAIAYRVDQARETELGRAAVVFGTAVTIAAELPEARPIHIVVRVLTQSKAPIASSPIHYGVSGDVEIDIDLPDPLAGRSEYERLTAMLEPWLGGRALAALPAEERAALPRLSGAEEALISRLAVAQARAAELAALLPSVPAPGPSPKPAAAAAPQPASRAAPAAAAVEAEAKKAGENLRRAAEEAAKKATEELRRAADEAARLVKEPPAALELAPPLYALLAAYGEAPLPALLLHSRTAVQRELERAAKEKIVAPLLPAVAIAVAGALIAARDLLHFNLADDGRFADAKAIFWAPFEPRLRSLMLDVVLDSGGGAAAADTTGLTAAQKGLVGEVFALFAAVGRHAPMLAALASQPAVPSIFKRGGAGLDQDRLHLMTAAEWRALAERAGTPASYAGRDEPEAAYAADIAAAIAHGAPGRGLAARLRASSVRGTTALADALAAHPAFDIRATPVQGYFAGEGKSAALGEGQVSLLAAVQRAVRLAPDGDFAVAETLLERGFTSGYSLLTAGKRYVRDQLAPILGADTVDLVYRNAQQSFADTYSFSLLGQSSWPTILVSGAFAEEGPELPNLTTLFGNADYCTCAHCQSVYGPASYLADLLHWMRSDLGAYDELVARRPDIPKILLNCANANVAMPYIDIVNEVLAYGMLAPGTGPVLGTLQTHGETADRLLEPEYRAAFAAADLMLLKAEVQWRLPYDPAYDEARACLDAMGPGHAGLVEALSRRDWSARGDPERTAWACARFGIISEELAIIVTDHANAGSAFWAGRWGLLSAPGSLVKPLLGTGEFADLAALVAVLEADYVSKADGPFPFHHVEFPPDAPCDLDRAFLAKADGSALALDVAAADRLMRFERLRRRAGLSAAELDNALNAFGGSGLTKAFVQKLAAATAAAAALRLPLDTLSAWFKTPATDRSGELAASLGIAPADLAGAEALLLPSMVRPWQDPDVTLQFLRDFDRLRDLPIAPAELKAMLEGSGRWQLDATGQATAKATAAAAKAAWEAMEAALAPLPPADGNAPAKAKTDRANAIDLALATALGLPIALFNQLVYSYVSAIGTAPLAGPAWREQFYPARETVSALGVKTEHRTWDAANPMAGTFTEMYRYLWRYEWILAATGLDAIGAVAVQFIAAVKENPGFFTADFPVPLDLLFNRFGPVALTGAPLVWLRRGVAQIQALAVSPLEFFFRTSAVKMNQSIPSFSVWATAQMDTGSVLAGLDPAALQDLADNAQPFEQADDFGALVARVLDLTMLREDVGLPLAPLVALVWETPPTTNVLALESRFDAVQAAQLKATLKAAAGTGWADLWQPIANRLRRGLRDALVAYHLGQHLQPDVAHLYNHFLIDPEMEPCMKTSRIVHATTACQTIVQRGLLGLEPSFSLDEGDKKQWVWRKNYRVWEANRKVFLYPENWTYPSLRLVKTPLFAEAQEHLLQDELNPANAEKVFNTYLTKLEDISRLDIRATYYDDVEHVSYVFARTWAPPYAYFYRWRDLNWRWSAWEEIPLDIESDHLIPMIFNRRLYLFWPTFTAKEHRKYRTANDEGCPYLELRLCYSKLEFGKWAPKKQYEKVWISGLNSGPDLFDENLLGYRLTRAPLVSPKPWPYERTNEVLLEPKAFYFWAEEQGGDLVIHVRRSPYPSKIFDYLTHEVDFVISGCDERLELRRPSWDPNGPGNYLARPWGSDQNGQQLSQSTHFQTSAPWTIGVRTDESWAYWSYSTSPLLGKAHYPYTLTYPHQWQAAIPYQSFFLADRRHTHLLTRFWLFWAFVPELHEHPYCCDMLRALHRDGVEGLLAAEGDTNPLRRQQADKAYFATEYLPFPNRFTTNLPTLNFDFSATGAYSAYNWEIFFHMPALIGNQLRLDGKYAEALRWLSFIFDPTNRDDNLGASRVWKVKRFYEHITEGSIAALMQLLQSSKPQDQAKRQAFAAQIAQWQKHPFEPHAVAELRIQAYMRWTVMEYIETLLDWGDKLFRQFTTESVNEALQLYTLAKQILGPKPRQVEGKTRPDRTFEDLLATLDQFSNAAAAVENLTTPIWNQPSNGNPRVVSPPALYFCIPENPQLLAYWDRVDQRLFCIRNCRDIDGNLRELALFAPEIDPGMLVKAVASGLDLSEILDSLAAPNPRHRFSYLLPQASSFCAEVKALGGQLLAALKDHDGEALADLQNVHQINLLSATRALKKMAAEEAKQALAAAEYARKLAEIRHDHYSTRQFMIAEESTAKALTDTAHNLQIAEHGLMVLSGVLALLEMDTGTSGNGVHFAKKIHPATAVSLAGQALGAMASSKLNKASRALTAASYIRRWEDVTLQTTLAAQEIKQADKQVAAAEIRLAMAEKELENHDLQVEQAKAVREWMRSKFTNEQLYGWMSGKLKTLHRQAYNLAYTLARQAQKAFQLELGRTENYVQFGAWDGGHAGLLAGETLGGQLRQLEAAYMRFNDRDFELSRGISLRLLDPAALMDLIGNGKAQFEIPEWLLRTVFEDDMKLYAMRIKSIAVSLTCVTGPYTPTSVKLRLLNSAIGWKPTDDLTTPSWVPPDMASEIVTSTAVNDPALFEANLRDERYLPFENAGAVSQWEVSLPTSPEFDYQTISDLVLHMRFVARGNIDTATASASSVPRPDLLASWRHDFPDEWTTLLSQLTVAPAATASNPGTFDLPIPDRSALPYRLRVPASTTAIAPHSVWILYRDAGGVRTLSARVDLPATTVPNLLFTASKLRAAVVTATGNRVLTVSDLSTAPKLTYQDPAGAGTLVVEDILIAFTT